MKKILVAFAIAAFASMASAQVSGSAHDFTIGSKMSVTVEHACRGCHTPHGASMASNLIWAPAAYTTAGYTLYTGAGTIDAKGVGACMSCHASNTFTNMNPAFVWTTAQLGSDLTNDHPVGSGFTVGGAAEGFQSPVILGGVTVAVATQMTCSVCHSVHNQNAVAASSLLKTPDSGSNICNACHNK